jgi:outer membrane lipopolysaccharide assembly protein LptE/RlpB
MTKIHRNLFFIALIQIFLSGCGFTTYNINSLPPQLKQLYYQTDHPYAPFEVGFKKKLVAAGIKVLSTPKKSTPTIIITSLYNHDANNSASSTQARIYNLSYTATVTINDGDNKQLLAPQIATVSRSITLQPNEIFEATSQVAIIKQEMRQELTTKIFNILSSPKTFQALKNPTP